MTPDVPEVPSPYRNNTQNPPVSIYAKNRQTANQQKRLIHPSAPLAQETRESAFAVSAIILHIADIIQIQHSHARQSDCRSTPENLRRQILDLQIVTADRTEQPEEQKHP